MKSRLLLAAGAASLLAACNSGAATGERDPAVQELIDRAAIENLLISYYTHLGADENDDFAAYYTEDAVFDVNCLVANGRDAIVALYDNPTGEEQPAEEEGEPAEKEAGPVGHMLLTNMQIDIDGDTAEATTLWTQVLNTDPYGPPTLLENGREYDQLVRQEDGSWLIKHRVVIADSAMPDFFRATYKPRLDFSFDKEEGE